MSRYFGDFRGVDTYGGSSRPKSFDSFSQPSQMTPRDKIRMLEMEELRIQKEKERMMEKQRARENLLYEERREMILKDRARQMEMKQDAMMMEQEKAIMLEREKLKRMEDEAERMRRERSSRVVKFADDYGSSFGSTKPFNGEDHRTSSYSARNTFDKGSNWSPPRSRMTMSGGRGENDAFERNAPWAESKDTRNRDVDLAMQKSRFSEKRGMRDDSFEFSSQRDMPKRRRMQDQRTSFNDGLRNKTGMTAKPFLSEEIRNPMYRSPPNKGFANKGVSLARHGAIRGSANIPTERETGFRSSNLSPVSVNRSLDQGIPVNRNFVWSEPRIGSSLSPLFLRDIEQQARKLIQKEEQKTKQFPLRKDHVDGRNFGFQGGNRSTTGPGKKFQDSKAKVQVKRLEPAYNKTFQAKPQLKKNDAAKSATGSKASKMTAFKKKQLQTAWNAMNILNLTPSTPRYCIFCKIQYKNKETYRVHLKEKKHTNIVTKMENSMIARMLEINQLARDDTKGAEYKKICTTCCQEFVGNYQKHSRMRVHIAKMYKLGVSCDLCNISFRRRFILNRHLASLQHARNLACSLRKEGKFVDYARHLKFPETFDGKSLGMDFLQDVKSIHCYLCDFTSTSKTGAINAHCKSAEHHENFKKWAEKAKARRKAHEEKIAAEKKAKETTSIKTVKNNQTVAKKIETASQQSTVAKKKLAAAKKVLAAATKQPVAAKKQPVAAKKQPVAAKKAPVAAEKQPATPKESSVMPTKQSAAATKQPATAKKAPVTPNKAPVTPNKAPVTAKKSPVTAKKSPVTAKKSPVTAKKSPVTPKKAPVTPKKAPVTPTKQPATAKKETKMTEEPASVKEESEMEEEEPMETDAGEVEDEQTTPEAE